MSSVSSQIVERIPYQTLPSGRGDDSDGGRTDKLLMYVFSGTYRASRWELVIQRTPVESSECMCMYIYLFVICIAIIISIVQRKLF